MTNRTKSEFTSSHCRVAAKTNFLLLFPARFTHARYSSRMIDRFLNWGDHGKPKGGKIKGRCQPPLMMMMIIIVIVIIIITIIIMLNCTNNNNDFNNKKNKWCTCHQLPPGVGPVVNGYLENGKLILNCRIILCVSSHLAKFFLQSLRFL